jgi:hypothetical protein
MDEIKSGILEKVQSILKKIETIRDNHINLKGKFIDTIFKRVIDKFTSKMTDKTKYEVCLSVKSNTIKDNIFNILTRHEILKLNTEKVEEFEIDINPFAKFTISGDILNALRIQYNEIVIKILNIGNSIRNYDYGIDKLNLPSAIDKYVSSKDVQDGFNFYSTINDRIGNICFSEDAFVELMNASLVGSNNPENRANNESSVSSNSNSNSNSNISNFESFNNEALGLGLTENNPSLTENNPSLTENNPNVENRTPFPHSNVYPESSRFSDTNIVMNNTHNPLYSGRTDGEVHFGNDGAKDHMNNALRDIMSQSDVATTATPAPTAKVATEAEATREAREREAAEAREREVAEAREREAAEAREREAAEAREREAAEAREREAAEAREREATEARETAEREAAEAREREATEAREREATEARETAEREATEARETAEREATEARETAEREAAEAREREATEARETAEREAAEARETAEREAAEAREREAAEASETAEREAAEAKEREAAEARETAEREAAEARETAEREAAEAREREAAEARETAEREAAEAREREATEARETAEREAAEARETAEREAAEARETAEREAAEAREREAAQGKKNAWVTNPNITNQNNPNITKQNNQTKQELPFTASRPGTPDKDSEYMNHNQGLVVEKEKTVQEDAKKLVKSYIEVIIPLMKKDEKDEKYKINLTRIQGENRGIYENHHKGQTDMNGHLMDIHKDKIVQEYREQYILGYLATTNRQKAIDKIQRAGDAKWAKIIASKEYTTDPAKIGSSKMTIENHNKKIEKLIRDAKRTTKYYGYDYPKFGWNTLDSDNIRFNRILNFFKFTFGYDEINAIKQATTFSPPWHIDRPSPTTVKPTGLALKTFVNVWGTGEMHEKETTTMKIKGGRKTKKKRKKNASPSKTRKVKKQKK